MAVDNRIFKSIKVSWLSYILSKLLHWSNMAPVERLFSVFDNTQQVYYALNHLDN